MAELFVSVHSLPRPFYQRAREQWASMGMQTQRRGRVQYTMQEEIVKDNQVV